MPHISMDSTVISHLLAGSIGGAAGIATGQPFDT